MVYWAEFLGNFVSKSWLWRFHILPVPRCQTIPTLQYCGVCLWEPNISLGQISQNNSDFTTQIMTIILGLHSHKCLECFHHQLMMTKEFVTYLEPISIVSVYPVNLCICKSKRHLYENTPFLIQRFSFLDIAVLVFTAGSLNQYACPQWWAIFLWSSAFMHGMHTQMLLTSFVMGCLVKNDSKGWRDSSAVKG